MTPAEQARRFLDGTSPMERAALEYAGCWNGLARAVHSGASDRELLDWMERATLAGLTLADSYPARPAPARRSKRTRAA